jgi:L-amino acid N-acyltransferase YncA
MDNIREYRNEDLTQMTEIWNEVVEDGNSFPQIKILDLESAARFFAEQTFTGVFEIDNEVLGLYILHPNNVGRCAHIANTSYAVIKGQRGKKIGEKLILHSLETARNKKFRIMQFNAVTITNNSALHLYEKLGFIKLGMIPGGFLNIKNEYIDIILFYKNLV